MVALFDAGERTLIHGDDHIGNLFVDAGRTGFFDWAVASRAPGVRDVAYFMCNSLPIEVRRANEQSLLARYLKALAANGWTLDEQTAHEQYRIFSIYSGSPRCRRRRWAPSGSPSSDASRVAEP